MAKYERTGRTDGPAGQPATDWLAVAVVLMAGVTVAMQIGKIPASLPSIRADFDMSLRAAAWVISIFSVIGMVAGTATGLLGDRYGYRRLAVAALVILAIGNFWGAAATTTASLLMSRFFEGVAFVAITVMGPPLFLRFSEQRHWRRIFGVWGTYWPVGLSSMLLATPIALATIGWRGLWVANGIIVLFVAGLLWWTTRNRHDTTNRAATMKDTWQAFVLTATSRGPAVLALIFTVYSATVLTVLSFLPTLYLSESGITPARAATLTAAVAAVNMFGNLSAGIALQKGAARWALITGGFISMTVLAAIVFATDPPFAVRFAAALGFSLFGGVIPTACLSGSAVHAPAPHLVGATNGIIMQGAGLGQLAGPVITTIAVTAYGGWTIAPWVFGVNAAIGIGLAILLRGRERAIAPA